jgi:hypothetical protein
MFTVFSIPALRQRQSVVADKPVCSMNLSSDITGSESDALDLA